MKRKIFGILFALVLALTLSLVPAVPAMAQTANFVPNTGPVGTVIAVTGTEWEAAGETIDAATGVTVGGVAATHTLTVVGGNLSGNINVPTLPVGLKDIVIIGSVSGTQTFSNAFTVTATANFVPNTGPVGTVIAVTGTGWAAAGETIDAATGVTVGGVAATHTLTVVGGNLSGNINVPTLPGGLKDIVITGSVTTAQTFSDAFTVTAAANFVPNTGPVGTVIAVTGTGWAAAGETIDAATGVTVGGEAATHTLTVDAGNLSGNINVPTLPVGLKEIVITGSVSGPQTFSDAFTVTATANFVPNTGPVGTVIAVTGTGWAAAGETIDAATGVTVGGEAATHTLTVDAGNLSGDITVPILSVGLKDIVITGSVTTAQTFSDAFTVTATANFVPNTGPVGTVIAVTGTGWAAAGETIDAATGVTVGGEAATHTLTVDAGNLSGDITVPTLPVGLKEIVITGSVSGPQTFSDAFTVTPTPTWGGGWVPPAPTPTIEANLFGEVFRFRTTTTGEIRETIQATSEDGNLTLTIPVGTIALDKDGNPLSTLTSGVDVSPPPPLEGANIIGLAYNFGSPGATFDPPITLEYTYDPAEIPEGVAEEDLVILYYDEEAGEWVECDCTCDPETDCITARVCHFTTFAIIAHAAPAAFSASNLSIQPSEVQPKEAVTISVLVTNTGDLAGSYEVTLKIDNVVEASKEITVNAGASEKVTFTTAKDMAGSYSVAVNGLSGSFTVKEEVAPPAPPPPPPPPPEVKPFPWPVIWGIIGGVVVAGVIIFFLVRRRAA